MVKPKPISDSAVRITDINVRSALIRVRWKDIPVRRAASSVAISPDDDSDVARLLGAVARCLPLLWADVSQHRSWTSRICGAGMLKSACVLRLAVQEVTQKRPNRGDGAKSTHLFPVRRKRCANDVGGELERERRDQPSREVEPDSTPIRACDSRRAHDSNGVTNRFHRSRGNNDDRDRLNGEGDRMSDRIEDRFHPRSTHPVTDATRTMQRNPKWHVDVSIGCAMRAEGRYR